MIILFNSQCIKIINSRVIIFIFEKYNKKTTREREKEKRTKRAKIRNRSVKF